MFSVSVYLRSSKFERACSPPQPCLFWISDQCDTRKAKTIRLWHIFSKNSWEMCIKTQRWLWKFQSFFFIYSHFSTKKEIFFKSDLLYQPSILGHASKEDRTFKVWFFQAWQLKRRKLGQANPNSTFTNGIYLFFSLSCVCLYYTFPPAFKGKLIKRICLAFLLLKGEGCHFCVVLQDRFCKWNYPSRGNPARRGQLQGLKQVFFFFSFALLCRFVVLWDQVLYGT